MLRGHLGHRLTAMSSVEVPDMSRLEAVKSHEEEYGAGAALCCGPFCSCFKPKTVASAGELRALKAQEGSSLHGERAAEPRTMILGGLDAWLSLYTRKSYTEPRQPICCLMEPQGPVWLIQMCRACATLHYQPNFIEHCLLEPPDQRPHSNTGHVLVACPPHTESAPSP
ncbi:uncharacterized protein LOC143817500 [Ranitomeya variabilis]|uniref:uncharacterized protein LOC143817500 n=1 Tax=Ranitomeya variabilis TaxID=490064 RepID=UPI0040572D4E